MSEKMILSFPCKPESRAAFLEAMAAALPETRAYEGNLAAKAWIPENDAGLLWVFEEWETREHQQKYFEWRAGTGMMEAVAPFLAGPPQVIWIQEP